MDNADCRAGEACLQQTDGSGLCGPACSWPVIQLEGAGTELYTTSAGEHRRYRLTVRNWRDFSDELFAPAPDLPPCGANTSAARSWVDILDATTNSRIYRFCDLRSASQLSTTLWFGMKAEATPPKQIKVTMTDRRAGRVYCSNIVMVVKP